MNHRVTRIALGVASAFAAMGAVPAYGYFTQTESVGRGTGTGGTILPLEAVALAAEHQPGQPLIPGSTADAVINVHNPNAVALRIVAVAPNGSPVVQGGTGSCDSATSGVTISTVTGLSLPVGPGATELLHLNGAVSMSAASATGCQGATFELPVRLTVVTP